MIRKTTPPSTARSRRTACRIALAACAALMLAACTADSYTPDADDPGTAAPVPVTLTVALPSVALPAAQPAGAPGTRTVINADGETRWTNTDRLGIFMLTTRGTLPGDIVPDADNREFAVLPDHSSPSSASGTLSPADGTPLLYPRSDTAVDIIAYYPYAPKGTGAGQVTAGYDYLISVADQSRPEAIDVLYAKFIGVEKSTRPVSLFFRHVLSKIRLHIVPGDGLNGLTAANITAVGLTGMPSSATLALHNGWPTAGVEKKDLSARRLAALPSGAPTGTLATFEAIVVPQGRDEYPGRTITVTVGGKTYTAALPDGDECAGDHINTYTVTVQNKGITLGAVSIAPWSVNRHEPGTAVQVINGIEVVRIPAGTFLMGSPDTDSEANDVEKPRNWVRLTQGFYMGMYEVTRTQYAEFLNATGVPKADADQFAKADVKGHGVQNLFQVNQWGWTPKWNEATGKWEATDDYPMINVTWYGAKAFADWAGGRLPTEAQWEYACRAGTTTRYSFGDDASALGGYAVYKDNKEHEGPSRVGTKNPNPWGLYDMHGNVNEWCLDQWDLSENYPPATTEPNAVVDPQVTEGNYRMFRGGDWVNSEAWECRSACRKGTTPGGFDIYTGFRVAFPE